MVAHFIQSHFDWAVVFLRCVQHFDEELSFLHETHETHLEAVSGVQEVCAILHDKQLMRQKYDRFWRQLRIVRTKPALHVVLIKLYQLRLVRYSQAQQEVLQLHALRNDSRLILLLVKYYEGSVVHHVVALEE